MIPNLLVRTAIVTATVASLAALGAAPAAAEVVEGTITHVELHDTPRHVMVRSGGQEVQVRISNRTAVDFSAADKGYFSDELSSLKPGMEVRASVDASDQPARRISVLNVSSDVRRGAIDRFERERDGSASSSARASELADERGELKVRLTDVDHRRGTFRADFRGSERTFTADDPKILARYAEGDLVFVKVRGNDEVVDIRSAAIVGRIVDIDHTAGRLVVSVDGREETYKMDRAGVLAARLAEGDQIRFEYEERSGGEMFITDVDKIRGVGRVQPRN